MDFGWLYGREGRLQGRPSPRSEKDERGAYPAFRTPGLPPACRNFSTGWGPLISSR
jgi:hypothetical protein